MVVDQAIGFTAERLGVPTSDAFDMLRRYARTHAQHLTPTARQVGSAAMLAVAPTSAAWRGSATAADRITDTGRDDILAALTRLPSPT